MASPTRYFGLPVIISAALSINSVPLTGWPESLCTVKCESSSRRLPKGSTNRALPETWACVVGSRPASEIRSVVGTNGVVSFMVVEQT